MMAVESTQNNLTNLDRAPSLNRDARAFRSLTSQPDAKTDSSATAGLEAIEGNRPSGVCVAK